MDQPRPPLTSLPAVAAWRHCFAKRAPTYMMEGGCRERSIGCWRGGSKRAGERHGGQQRWPPSCKGSARGGRAWFLSRLDKSLPSWGVSWSGKPSTHAQACRPAGAPNRAAAAAAQPSEARTHEGAQYPNVWRQTAINRVSNSSCKVFWGASCCLWGRRSLTRSKTPKRDHLRPSLIYVATQIHIS
jgi:hypothetical protein